MKRLLVLRPEPGASETVARARECGLQAEALPIFALEVVEWEAPEAGSFDALLLTSANAVRCGGDRLTQLRGLPVHAVGRATADAARHAGFDISSSGEAGVDRLLKSVDPELKLLHPCGEHHKTPIDAPQAITPLVVYRSREIEHADLSKAGGVVALIHSQRAGRHFASLIDAEPVDRATVAVAAISDGALEACGGGWADAKAADKPSDHALLALAARLCNNS